MPSVPSANPHPRSSRGDAASRTQTDTPASSAGTRSELGQQAGFRQYRVPPESGEALIDPSFARAGELISQNRRRGDWNDSFWIQLRTRARQQMVEDAVRYTSAYRDTHWAASLTSGAPAVAAASAAAADNESSGSGVGNAPPIVMAGHQPTLFHAGVWFKNFALDHLGRQLGALPINLVIDNDVAMGSAVRVPTIDPDTGLAQYASVPFDARGGGLPHEQSTIRDRDVFDHFDAALSRQVRPFVADPCVRPLWQHAREALNRCGVAGCALAQARHGLEGDAGLQTLELPLGVLCRGQSFARFLLAILTELPRFQRCYNDSADFYRSVHGIRSSAHPVPNLAQVDDWFEAPLWVYGNQSPARRSVWVRLSNQRLVIGDRTEREVVLDISNEESAADQLADALSSEFKLRPRALLTTMYARLVLSDLFLHGIGGGKYDQLGDVISRAFFELDPPEFMVLSATVKLPGLDPANSTDAIARVRAELRDTVYSPERIEEVRSSHADLVERKQALLQRIPPRGQKKAWHDEVTRINAALAHGLQDYRAMLRSKLADLQRRAASDAILGSREHPFCIFPLEYLATMFQSILRGTSIT